MGLGFHTRKVNLAMKFISGISANDANHEGATYRIAKRPCDIDNRVHFQVIGKNIILKMLPEKLMRDNLLMGFAKSECIEITYMGTGRETANTQQKNKHLYRLIKQVFIKSKALFIIEKNDGNTFEYTSSELINNRDILADLNGIDGATIGYTAAQEKKSS